MLDFFSNLTTLQQIYWGLAIAGTIILIILIILNLLGSDVDDFGDVDADIDADTGIDFQFLSFKNITGFFTIFGWSGIASLDAGLNTSVALIISTVCGLLMMLLMAFLFYNMKKLADSGTMKYKNAIGGIGEVYLPIGANRSSIGKISIQVQGAVRELQAITDEDTKLESGTIIEVKEVTSNGILIVTKNQ